MRHNAGEVRPGDAFAYSLGGEQPFSTAFFSCVYFITGVERQATTGMITISFIKLELSRSKQSLSFGSWGPAEPGDPFVSESRKL